MTRWNKYLTDEGAERSFICQARAFTATSANSPDTSLTLTAISSRKDDFENEKDEWLPTIEDREYVRSLMHPVTEPGKIANWIAPPNAGIKGKPFEFEYVRF